MSGSVWVVTRRLDATADVVIDALNRRGVPVVRFDWDEITVSAELVGSRWVGQLRTKTRTARIEDTVGIYYRRPTRAAAPHGADAEIGAWIEAETRWGLGGLLAALPKRQWINWPPGVHAAEHKPYQLATAAACGLPVPRTAIVNDPDAAAHFVTDAGPVLYKAFRGKPVRIAGRTRLTYATPVSAEQCRSETIRMAPAMLQARIDKGGSHRAELGTDRGPDPVRARLLDFMARLELRFAACDLCVDHAGVWWLIEANPVGQWAWDHPLRDEIASALADALSQEIRSS